MTNSRNLKHVYFPSLNGVRFLAALLVFIYHVEQVKERNGMFSVLPLGLFKNAGSTGVSLFFVLSGFLITYLLLQEKRFTGEIRIRAFYVRRILRIWPLYFLTIGLSLVYAFATDGIPTQNLVPKATLYLTFLANVAVILFSAGGFPIQLWSVASEEQFYLIWPWIVKYWKKYLPYVLAGIFFLFLFLRLLFYYYPMVFGETHVAGLLLTDFLSRFIDLFRVDCMAAGAFGAYWVFHEKTGILNIIYNKWLSLVVVLISVLLIVFVPNIGRGEHSLYSLMFMILIVNLSTNPNFLFSLETRIFDEMGKISYGLYVFHPLAIFISLKFINSVPLTSLQNDGFLKNFALTIFAFSLTTLAARLSYRYFEKPFLKTKLKYSQIVSGDAVKTG